MRLVLINEKDKSITVYENRKELAVFELESGDFNTSPEFIEELRTAEYKESA